MDHLDHTAGLWLRHSRLPGTFCLTKVAICFTRNWIGQTEARIYFIGCLLYLGLQLPAAWYTFAWYVSTIVTVFSNNKAVSIAVVSNIKASSCCKNISDETSSSSFCLIHPVEAQVWQCLKYFLWNNFLTIWRKIFRKVTSEHKHQNIILLFLHDSRWQIF